MRKSVQRKRTRERAKYQRIIDAHERAGDIAREHYLHEDSAQHYQHALNVPVITPADRARILVKHAQASFMGNDPAEVSQPFDTTLTAYLANPIQPAKTIEMLLQKSQRLWSEAKTQPALALVKQAKEVAENSGDSMLCAITSCTMATRLQGLTHFEQAAPLLKAVEKVVGRGNALLRAKCYTQTAIAAAAIGEASTAFERFEQALSAAREVADDYNLAATWEIYAFWARTLGHSDIAKASYERALLIARQRHITWFIPFACLSYASFLFLIGRYKLAHEYLLNALSYELDAPILEEILAEVGIPIALRFKDDATLAKCARLPALDHAFRSENSSCIGPAAGAFATWYVARGQERAAQELLHRAIRAVDRTVHTWELPLVVAQHGAFADIPKARRLIEERAALPSAEVAQACLSLFDAFVARRRGNQDEVHVCALAAVKDFGALQWYCYVDMAHALLPATMSAPKRSHLDGKSAHLQPLLTTREQQVVDLVLKGLTNRDIASALAVTKRTVEAHMTSIMGRLGVRSRHQVVDQLADM